MISRWLSADHARLDGFFRQATATDRIAPEPFARVVVDAFPA
jgi:hypothetical protein